MNQDALFLETQREAQQVVNNFIKKNGLEKNNTIVVYPREYDGKLKNLLGHTFISDKFGQNTCTPEGLKIPDGEINYLCFFPNDPSYLSIAAKHFESSTQSKILILMFPMCGNESKEAFENFDIPKPIIYEEFPFSLISPQIIFPESPFAPIQEQAQNEFNEISKQFSRKATIAFPKFLRSRILRLFGLKYLSFNYSRVISLEELQPCDDECELVVFLPNDADVAKQAIKYMSTQTAATIFILAIPRIGTLFERELEKAEFGERLKIIEFHFDLLQCDSNFFINIAPNCFHRVFVEGDVDDLTAVARTLNKIQVVCGKINNVYSVGKYSKIVKSILAEQEFQIGIQQTAKRGYYDKLIIIDRNVDLITPLLTQVTYSGIMNEKMGLSYGVYELPNEVSNDTREFVFTDANVAYQTVRRKKIDDGANELISAIKNMQSMSDKKGGSMSPDQFLQFKDQIQVLTQQKPLYALQLAIMSHLTEQRFEYFKDLADFEFYTLMGQREPPVVAEKMMLRDENWTETIREFCLVSVVRDGVPEMPLTALRMRLVQRFGLEFIDAINDLQRVGLLKQANSIIENVVAFAKGALTRGAINLSNPFNSFKLVLDEKSREDADKLKAFLKDDIGYFYDGYAPFSARIVQAILTGKMREGTNMRDCLESRNVELSFSERADTEEAGMQRVLVFIVGGVAESEVFALQQLGTVLGGRYEITVGATSVTSGADIVQQTVPLLREVDAHPFVRIDGIMPERLKDLVPEQPPAEE